jgi:DNA-3-methyladenine glycosylase
MAKARGLADLDLTSKRDLRKLASGPGKLCEALGITRPRDNDKDMLSPTSDLQVISDGFRTKEIAITQRIGITKSMEMPLRYVVAGNAFLSRK